MIRGCDSHLMLCGTRRGRLIDVFFCLLVRVTWKRAVFLEGGGIHHTGLSALDIASIEIWGLQSARSTYGFARSDCVWLFVLLERLWGVKYGWFDLY